MKNIGILEILVHQILKQNVFQFALFNDESSNFVPK